jgi:phosphate transport system permease protein
MSYTEKHSDWRRVLSPTGNTGDAVFRLLMLGAGLFVVSIVIAMVIALASDSMLSIRQFGWGFLTSKQWNPIKGEFGALPFIYGTIVS